MLCTSCNERLEGDGYTSALHCPYISEQQQQELECREADADPLYCELGETYELLTT